MCEPTLFSNRRFKMNYEEFKQFKEVKDNNFVKKFATNEGHVFYIEPAFYTQFLGLLERYPEQKDNFLKEMFNQINKNKEIAFVYDFENPFLDYGDAILREFTDVTDACKIFYEDKSRGSDYGD